MTRLNTSADLGLVVVEICFVVYCNWLRCTDWSTNESETSVHSCNSKIPPPSIQNNHSDTTWSAVGNNSIVKMQILGLFAIILTLYVVHATEYFREQFLDGGK